MDKVTQSNAANAEESASASEELSAQARELQSYVNVLLTMVRGRDGVQSGQHMAGGASTQRAQSVGARQPIERRLELHPAHGNGSRHENGNSKKEFRTLEAPHKSRIASLAGARRNETPSQVIPLDDDELKQF
jgi:methyl-accepting chemotaxis protein